MPRDEEHQLPDDLTLLGEELAASAAHLASVYPAPKFAGQRAEIAAADVAFSPRPQRSLRSWALVLTGTACAVAVLLALPYWMGGQRNPAAQLVVVAPEPPSAAPSIKGDTVETIVPVLPAVQQAFDVSPAVFHDLSAPELEGMLDLLEQEPAVMRMSI